MEVIRIYITTIKRFYLLLLIKVSWSILVCSIQKRTKQKIDIGYN